MRRLFPFVAFLGVFSAVCVVHGQNLLVNGDLEASPAFTYYDGSVPSVADDVPGWTLLSFGDASSWVQVAFDVGAGTTDVDLAGSETDGADPDFIGLSGLQTASLNRPAVAPLSLYGATVTYDNYFGSAGISYFIDWFDGSGLLLSSSGGPLSDPNTPLVFTPYTQLFEIADYAPAGAATAGVRFISENGSFAGATADNFTFSAIPEPCSTTLICLAGLTFMNARRRRR